MELTGGDVDAFIAQVVPAKRRRDAETLIALHREVTGFEPELWGTIVGFGTHHYRYDTGREGDTPAAAFAPRKAASTIYLADGAETYGPALARLGPHTTALVCLYIKDLEAVDLSVLKEIVADSFSRVSAGAVGRPARDSGA